MVARIAFQKGIDILINVVARIILHQQDIRIVVVGGGSLLDEMKALPISIVEAFRAGLPVIAADTSGVEELVDSSVGDVLPIGDVKAFAESVLRICGNNELRNKLAAEALNRSKEERFSPDYIHLIFENNYAKILGI